MRFHIINYMIKGYPGIGCEPCWGDSKGKIVDQADGGGGIVSKNVDFILILA
jgi:hypothetical protein